MAHDIKIEDDKVLNHYSLSEKEIKALRDFNKRLRERQTYGRETEHLARIPSEVYSAWMTMYGLKYPPTRECQKKILDLIQLPENKFLRTTERAI